MTRARAGNYEDKKQVILDRAAEIIARKGFEGATMIEVANACGTSKSHLYHYFSSKEDLLFSIVSEHITAQAEELADIMALPLSAVERFNRVVGAFVQRSAESRSEHQILMHDLKFLPQSQHEEVQQLEIKLVRMMSGLLREINPELMAPSAVQAPYALMVYGMVIWTVSWYEKNGPIAPPELAARISQLLIHGFKGSRFTEPRATPARSIGITTA